MRASCKFIGHFFVVLQFLLFARSQNSFAQTEINIFGAYRVEDDSPFSFSEVGRDEYLSELHGQEPSFIIARTPSVTFYTDSGAYQGYSYIRLRGMDQTRINMTLDGVPLSEPEDQGAYFSNYPDFLRSVSRYQVIRGLGASQNGTASYGGSILFETPSLLSPLGNQVGGGGGAFGTVWGFAQFASIIGENEGLYLRASSLHSDGYRRRSGNDGQSVFYKYGNLSRDNQWSFSGFIGHQENELAYFGSTLDEIAKDRRHNGNFEEDDEFLQSLSQVQNIRTLSSGDVLSTSVYYNRLLGNYDFDLNNYLGLPSTEELYNYRFASNLVGAFSNYQHNLDLGQVTTGVHANWYERRHIGSERALGDLYENTGYRSEYSGFIKFEYIVGDIQFLADMQIRHSTFDYSGAVPLNNLDWTFFNPKGGITYLYSNATNFYYSIGHTGREPTRNDIFLGNDDLIADESGSPIIGPTRAEYVLDQEFGVRTSGDRWSLQLNGFYLDFDNEIVLNGELGPSGLPLTDSVERSYRTGLELDFSWQLTPEARAETSAAIMRSRIREAGVDFTPVISPSAIANQAIEYSLSDLVFRADLRYQGSSYIDFANTKSTGHSFVTDISATYSLAPVEFELHLNNLFNERYFSNGYIDFNGRARYFIQAPRNLFLGFTWKL